MVGVELGPAQPARPCWGRPCSFGTGHRRWPLAGLSGPALLRFPRIDSTSISRTTARQRRYLWPWSIAYLLARDIVFESYMPLFVAVLE